jgi:hypothetical protein
MIKIGSVQFLDALYNNIDKTVIESLVLTVVEIKKI